MKQNDHRPGETVDTLFGGQVCLVQRRSGYRFTSDTVLLAHASLGARGSVIDLGTGCGVIPVIVARFGAASPVIGVEIQPDLCEVALRNVRRNGVDGRAAIVRGDIRRIKELFGPASFDSVVSNPPYLAVAAGRVNPDSEKAVAKHEVLCRIEDVLTAAKYLLRDRGVLRLVYPNMRLVDLIIQMGRKGLQPRHMRFVHDRADGPSKVCLVEAAKGSRARAEIGPPVIFRDAAGNPTEEYRRIFGPQDTTHDPRLTTHD